MKQVKSGHVHPKMLFLSGIGDYNKIKQGNKIIEVNQGQSNYLMQGDMVINLENNLPFLYS